jgi:hypothetical protein
MKRVFCAALIAACLMGQNAGGFRYSATTGNVSLSGAGTSFTVQQPQSGAASVNLEAAVVYCSVACTLTQAQNGTAATATAGTVNPLLPFGPASNTTVWTASNVGTGTPAGGALVLQAGIPVTLIMSGITLPKTGTATNYTFTISSITGTANITVYWKETP